MTGSHFGREGAENARSARRDSRMPIHEEEFLIGDLSVPVHGADNTA
jgi:hypothetical protein